MNYFKGFYNITSNIGYEAITFYVKYDGPWSGKSDKQGTVMDKEYLFHYKGHGK